MVNRSPILSLHTVPSFLVEGVGGGFVPINLSTSSSASYVRLPMYSFKLAFIERSSLQMWDWFLAGYRRAETLSSTSLHVATEIHAFFWPPGI